MINENSDVSLTKALNDGWEYIAGQPVYLENGYIATANVDETDIWKATTNLMTDPGSWKILVNPIERETRNGQIYKKEEKKMIKKDELKVGMRVRVVDRKYSEDFIGVIKSIDGDYALLDSETRSTPTKSWQVRFVNDGWNSNDCRGEYLEIVKGKSPKPPFNIRGHEPKLIVKIGCIELPWENCEKVARKLRGILKQATDGVQTTYKGEKITIEEIDSFLAWVKKVRK